MSKTAYELVTEFHQVFDAPVSDSLQLLDVPREKMRLGLIDEERQELQDALDAEDIVEVADALGDMIYVINGMAIEMGIPLDKIVAEIHRSNMSKLQLDGTAKRREDGKILKGPNYFKPFIKKILDEHYGISPEPSL